MDDGSKNHTLNGTATTTAEYTTFPSLNYIPNQEETANGNGSPGDISNDSTRLTRVTFLDDLTRPSEIMGAAKICIALGKADDD